METDLVAQVAETKCPRLTEVGFCHPVLLGNECETCQGTKLRWPILSREEVNYTGRVLGRVPDVDLEKVLDLIAESVGGLLQFSREHTDPDKGAFICRAGDTYQIEGTYEYTRLDAACAALLKT